MSIKRHNGRKALKTVKNKIFRPEKMSIFLIYQIKQKNSQFF